jgi:hypothetical protein
MDNEVKGEGEEGKEGDFGEGDILNDGSVVIWFLTC